MINIVITCINNDIAVTNKLDIISDIRNNVNASILIGGYSFNGSGKRKAIMVTGKNLSNTADNLDPYMVAYHFL